MSYTRTLFTLALLIGSLTACESLMGIKREAPLAGALDFSCVASTIRGLDGISNVVVISSRKIRYEIAGIHIDRQRNDIWTEVFTVDYRAGARLVHEFVGFNKSPPIADLEAARPTMLVVEEALRRHCAFAPEATDYRDRCNVRNCPRGA